MFFKDLAADRASNRPRHPAAALFLVAGLLLSAVEMLGGQRIGQIGTELALILSKQDLTDRAAAENNLRLEIFHMIGIFV